MNLKYYKNIRNNLLHIFRDDDPDSMCKSYRLADEQWTGNAHNLIPTTSDTGVICKRCSKALSNLLEHDAE